MQAILMQVVITLTIPEFRKQNKVITFPLEKIDLAQNWENASEMLEVLNAPTKQQNGTVCWVELRSHPHCKHHNCQSLLRE